MPGTIESHLYLNTAEYNENENITIAYTKSFLSKDKTLIWEIANSTDDPTIAYLWPYLLNKP